MVSLEKDKIARKLLGNFADAYIEPNKFYDKDLKVSSEYIDSLPDLQNDIYDGIRENIEHVGIHNFRLPLNWQKKSGGIIELETSVTGTVSLEFEKRGINMGRVIRCFYEDKNNYFNTDLVVYILEKYRKKIGSFDARISLKISYPIIQKSLRSNLDGYQYYNVSFDISVDRADNVKKVMNFDFVYSSACPCSDELAEHARKYRNRAAIPHSQRSVARISVEFKKDIWIEDLQQHCLNALKTETQVMVKREDEQAFAELNGSNPKFVEDASRLLFKELESNPDIKDFKIVLSHLESLHSHNAIAVIIKGVKNGFSADVSSETLESLVR